MPTLLPTVSSPAMTRSYSSYGRIVKWLDLGKPAISVTSKQDMDTQKRSLLANFKKGSNSSPMPWDKFINGPMPDLKQAVREPIRRNAFGAVIFATHTVDTVKMKLTNFLPKKKTQTNSLYDTTKTLVNECQRRRSTATLPGCIQQKALAWWVYTMLLKCFQTWKRGARLIAWSRKRPDPYTSYSSMWDSGDSGTETTSRTTCIDNFNSAADNKKCDNNMNETKAIPIPIPLSETIALCHSNTLPIEESPLSQSTYDDAVTFVDNLMQSRRLLVKRGEESVRTSMKPQVLITLRLKFLQLRKKNEEKARMEEAREMEEVKEEVEEDGRWGNTTTTSAPSTSTTSTTTSITTSSTSITTKDFTDFLNWTENYSNMERERAVKPSSPLDSSTAQPQAVRQYTQKKRNTTCGQGKNKSKSKRKSSNSNSKSNSFSAMRSSQRCRVSHSATAVAAVPRQPTKRNAATLVTHLMGSRRLHAGRHVQLPIVRVLLVDDSKPFRIRLCSMLRRLYKNIEIETCATPNEGLKTIMTTSLDSPIHIVIVDQVYVGTHTTGKQMCDILARRSKVEPRCNSPCVLVSGNVEVSVGGYRKKRQGSTSTAAVSSSNLSGNNIVEIRDKREITCEIVSNWFVRYVNCAPVVRRGGSGGEGLLARRSTLTPCRPVN